MCGLAGFADQMEISDKSKILKNMTDAIMHRGPDDSGYYTDEKIALGFRRLSIIDLDSGKQPITNEDESMILLFNGEIYNYKELRQELIEKGHQFKTETDSEVILHGYEEYGEQLFEKLRGMFAFVIWDKLKEELFGARDFFGIKPLYYAFMDQTFLFGSEIKSLVHHPGFKKELNHAALEHYLSFQYSPGPGTFFKNVYKLEPGHFFRYSKGEMVKKRYWIPEFQENDSKSLGEWIDETEKVFDDSVEAHKISDVEVGSFLSSGIDSSYVASSAKVDKTYTVGFGKGEKYNEISYAKELSDLIGVGNKSKVISADEFWEVLPKVQYHMDEPLADPAAVALYFVSALAAEDVKVVLSGEGADEIFGGYNIYQEPLTCTKYNRIPFPIRKVIGTVASWLPARRGLNFLVRRGKRLEERYIGNAYMFTYKERMKLLKQQSNAAKPQDLVKPYFDMVTDKDEVTKMQFLDLNMWMVGDILLKADKMSMANSLELRVPFLDKEIMGLASQLPTDYRTNRNGTKYVLRKAAARRLPEKWSGKKKLGFPVPIRVWLKEEKYYQQVRNTFLSVTAEAFFDTRRLIALLNEHKAGKADNSRKIWTVYTFLVWYKEYF
ncbi:MAG: asparagine synthase (glutamine-hydrolyzing) [Lachnospiraceae bacterium]